MSVLTKLNTWTPLTLIESAEVSAEFQQIIDALAGTSTTKDVHIKFNNATDPALRVENTGAGLLQRWIHNGTSRATLSALGKLTLPAGIGATPSTDTISNFGTYFVDPTSRATGANTTETDFSSKTVAA